MNRNTQSRFSINPTNLDMSRSKFDRSCQHKTTFNAGELIPIFVDEVLPGDTFSMSTSFVIRMSTPIHPVMDNLYLDLYYFFVPARLVWEHWEEFNGENKTSAWEQETVYEVPQLTAPSDGWVKGSIADYFGIPIGISGLSINALPFRAYCLIWNEWFRDQNLQDSTYFSLDDTTIAGSNGNTYQTDAVKGGMCLPVNKYHDYFTSALPEPQKGPDVLLPLGQSAKITQLDNPNVADMISPKWYDMATGNRLTQKYLVADNGVETGTNAGGSINTTDKVAGVALQADLSNATAATINQLRLAFQTQKLFEKDARGGTRYNEIIYSHFGVTSPDARQQRPEYLGGKRIPINISQVLQTSSTDETSPQGNTAAFSLTADSSGSFTKSFTEHGFIIGLACVRTDHTYQQGIERMWSRRKRFDFYWPVLANIGEQAILNKEIYAQGNKVDDEAFGYQEAWADYRYKSNRVSGAFRSTYSKPLDSWHFGDLYSALPTLGSVWISETKVNVDRTLAVTSSVEDQFIADFYFKNICVRPMPLYSIPGLIDHH